MVEVITFLKPTIIILAISLIILILIIIILTTKNKKLKGEVVKKEITLEREETMREEIENLKNQEKSPKEILTQLDSLARRFFREAFNVEKNTDYSEMIHLFKEKKRDEMVFFCEEMLQHVYSGEIPNKKIIDKLMSDFEFIYNEEFPQIITIPELNNQPQQKETEKIAKELASINISQVLDSYRELQVRFEKVYENVSKESNKENLNRLEKLRRILIKRVEEYQQDKFKIIELWEEISRGGKILDLVSK